MGKGYFLIITVNKFPFGDAGAVRLNAFAKIVLSKGFKPYVISLGESTDFSEKVFDNIKHISLRYPNDNFLYRILGRILYVKHFKNVINAFSPSDISAILFDSGSVSLFKYLKNYSKNYSIPLVFDDVEWYSKSEYKLGCLSPYYRHNNLINTKLIDDSLKLVAISTFLEEHFTHKDIRTIRIPVIMDVKNVTFNKKLYTSNKVIKIVYAGQVGGKDHLFEMVEAVSMLSEAERNRISFNVVGINREQFVSVFSDSVLNKCGNSVVFSGRVSREKVITALNNADFSFLLRPANERYAKAGFPTKIVEALSTGTPVICNLTSDLGLYLHNNFNSIIIEDCSAKACLNALRVVLSLSEDELSALSSEARNTALEYFDWENYSDSFINFVFEH